MPEISRFFGIIVTMYFNDHAPPHFHIRFQNFRAQMSIETLEILDGELPPKELWLIKHWTKQHQSALTQNWNDLQETGRFAKIEPLQ